MSAQKKRKRDFSVRRSRPYEVRDEIAKQLISKNGMRKVLRLLGRS